MATILLQRVCVATRDLFGATYVTLGILNRNDLTMDHPNLPWPRDECPGPGVRCANGTSPWWKGLAPAVFDTSDWGMSRAGPIIRRSDRLTNSARAAFPCPMRRLIGVSVGTLAAER